MKQDAKTFVDTSYFVALLNRSDRHHGDAVALAARWDRLRTDLITTDAVLVETYNWFARSPARATAARALGQLGAQPGWLVVHASPELIEQARKRYLVHGDKTWSLTDCISMEVAAAAKVNGVATTDHHFTQAGFEVLLPLSS